MKKIEITGAAANNLQMNIWNYGTVILDLEHKTIIDEALNVDYESMTDAEKTYEWIEENKAYVVGAINDYLGLDDEFVTIEIEDVKYYEEMGTDYNDTPDEEKEWGYSFIWALL